MMKVQLVFTASKSLLSKIIRTVTRSKWSHVDIAMGNGWLLSAQPLFGVHEVPVIDRLNKSIAVEVRDIWVDDAEVMYDYARKQLGKNYDYTGIFGVPILAREWQRSDSWFCSELVAKAALVAGSKVINASAWRISPEDLYQMTRPVE